MPLLPGPELDLLVAEHVLGWTHDPFHWFDAQGLLSGMIHDTNLGLPAFSEHPGSTWLVVDLLKRTHGVVIALYEDGSCRVELSAARLSYDPDNIVVTAESFPLALCLAALQAKGVALPA